jgi:hypothetical protein
MKFLKCKGSINYALEAVESDEMFMLMPKTLIGSWVFIHFITIAPISIGLYWDIFGVFPETDIALTYLNFARNSGSMPG